MAIKFLNSTDTDSGVLYVDATNNRVGIGTTTPTRSLSVESAASSVMADFKYTAGGFSSIILSNTNGSAHLASVGNDFLISPAGTERMRITSSGNVGIGTTSPTYKLDVAGDIIARDTYPSIYVDHSGTVLGGVRADATNKLEFKTLTTAPLSFQVNSSEKMRVTNAGNVGIGTTNPHRSLEVRNASGQGEFLISGTAGATLFFRPNNSYSSAGNFGIYTTGLTSGTYESTMTFKGYSGGVNNVMTLKGSGNVGIGTTAPGQKLQVNGIIYATSTFQTSGNSMLRKYSSGWNFPTHDVVYNGWTSSAGDYTYLKAAGNSDINHGIAVVGDNGFFVGRTNLETGSITDSTTDPIDTVWLRINSSGSLTLPQYGAGVLTTDASGNVTASTAYQTQATADGRYVNVTGDTMSGNLLPNADSTLRLGNSTNRWNKVHTRGVTSDGNTLDLQGSAIKLYNGTNTAMTINSSGNVGIGTTSPTQKLDVAGHILVGTPSGGSQSGYAIKFNKTSSSSVVQVGGEILASPYPNNTNGGNLIFKTANTSTTLNTAMVINAQQKVGIGTNDPQSMLSLEESEDSLYDVLGVYNSGFLGTEALGKGAAIRIGNNISGSYSTKIATVYEGNNPGWLQPALAFYTMYNSNVKGTEVERMRISANGNVGIGTASPRSKLEIKNGTTGQSYTNQSGLLIDVNGTSNSYSSLHVGSNSGANNFVVTNAGNTGIGIASPAEKLHVYDPASDNHLAKIRVQGGATSGYGELGIQSGYVRLFANGTITYAANATNTYWYTNSNSSMSLTATGLGIGTTSPSKKLHVSGDSQFDAGGSGQTILVGRASGQPSIKAQTDNGGHLILDSTSNFMSLNHYVGQNIVLANGGGNVGIGTTTPAYRLDVRTGVFNSTVAQFTGANDGRGLLISTFSRASNDDSVDFDAQYSGLGAMTFSIGGSEKMRVHSTGNVGIGTTSPSEKLHIENPTAVQFQLNQTGASTSVRMGSGTSYFFINAGSGGNSTALNIMHSSLYVGIGTTAPSHKLHINGDTSNTSLRVSSTDRYTGINFSDSLGNSNLFYDGQEDRFFTSSTLQVSTLDATSDIISAGTVTANTFQSTGGGHLRVLNPEGAAADLGSSVTGAIKVTLPQSWTNTMMSFTIKVFDYSQGESFETRVHGYNYAGGDGYWTNTSAYTISQSDTDRNFSVRFGHDGTKCCVIIGETTSTWAYLKVAVLDFQGTHSNYDSTQWNDGWAITSITTLPSNIDSNVSNTQIANWKRSGQNVYYGSGTGNVGIGTTSPSYKLHNTGTTRLEGALTLGGNVNNRISGVGTGILFKSNNDYSFTKGANTLVTIKDTGNVGIGTSSPSAKLDVQVPNNTVGIQVTNADGNTVAKLRSAGTPGRGELYLDNNGTTNVFFGALGNSYINAGNVGIGTTSPSEKLDVVGDIKASADIHVGGDIVSTATSLYDLLPNISTTFTLTTTLVANTWTSVTTGNTDIPGSGTYAIQVYFNDHAVGGTGYAQTYSGTITWANSTSTNNAGYDAISEVPLHRSGHAANSQTIYLRTAERTTSSLELQIKSDRGHTADTDFVFKLIKLI